jgi:DNA-binding PadR family transcriptional regulator
MTRTELETQNLARSCHEALILATLEGGPRHGYQLALEIEEKSEGYFRFNHGTLYPILHKLEARGLIEGAWQDPGAKRKRRQYSLTSEGREHLAGLRDAWTEYSKTLFAVIGGVEP